MEHAGRRTARVAVGRLQISFFLASMAGILAGVLLSLAFGWFGRESVGAAIYLPLWICGTGFINVVYRHGLRDGRQENAGPGPVPSRG